MMMIEDDKKENAAADDDEEERNIGGVGIMIAISGRQWESSCASNQREIPGQILQCQKSSFTHSLSFQDFNQMFPPSGDWPCQLGDRVRKVTSSTSSSTSHLSTSLPSSES